MSSQLTKAYYREDKLPHIWCPGCGHGIVLRAIVEAIDNAGLDKDKVCFVSGIGCSSRASGYVDFNTVHTAHGRALAYATGIKLANPKLHVFVVTGDGDCAAIGGNHLIHACRRNIDITTIVFNNKIFGMTGGQYSPATEQGDKATTAPYGNIEKDFDIAQLAAVAGATYVARGTVYHTKQLSKLIEKGIANKGFSLIESMSVCPTYYGRLNKKGIAAEMLAWQRDNCIDSKASAKLSPEQLHGKVLIGEFKNETAPEYTDSYDKIIEKARGMAK